MPSKPRPSRAARDDNPGPIRPEKQFSGSDRKSELALPECERLADTRANFSDYDSKVDPELLGPIRAWLEHTEDALVAGDQRRLEALANVAKQLQGLDKTGKRVRAALNHVAKAIEKARRPRKRPERVSLWLITKLAVLDPRYNKLGVYETLEHLRAASTGPGRGRKGAPATLAALMVDAGVQDSESEARKFIKNQTRRGWEVRSRPWLGWGLWKK